MSTRLTPRRTLAALALALALPLVAWAPGFERLTLQPESKLWVEGGSTIRSWSCKAADLSATIDGAPNAVAQIAAGEKAIRTVKVSIPAAQIDCGNGTMNDHMKKALKVEEHPAIVFTLAGYDLTKGATGPAGTLNGTLSLGGVTKTIAIPAQGTVEGGTLHVTGAYELKMTDYELKPPTLMFGRIKVRDAVTVKFDLLLKA